MERRKLLLRVAHRDGIFLEAFRQVLRLGRRTHLRVHQLGEILVAKSRKDVLRRPRAPLLELGQVAFVLSFLGEERFKRLQPWGILTHQSFGNGIIRPTARAARRIRAACSKLSIRWCATVRVSPAVTAP